MLSDQDLGLSWEDVLVSYFRFESVGSKLKKVIMIDVDSCGIIFEPDEIIYHTASTILLIGSIR